MGPLFLTIFTIIACLMAYILFIPIRLNLYLAYNENLIATSTIAIFPFRRNFGGEKKNIEKKPKPEKKVKTGDKPKKPSRKLHYSRIDRLDRQIIYQTFREAFRFVDRLIQSPDYYLHANITGGTEEPDVTGQLFGAYMAVRPMFPQGVAIQYRPDFLMERFSGELNLGLSVRVYDIVREIIVFLYRIPKIKLFKLYRKLKRSQDE